MKLIFCPHGQSDKGYHSSLLSPYARQDIVLLYGNLMKEMLIDLNLWDKIGHKVVVGNFRQLYYQKNRERLLKIAHTEIFSKLNRAHPTLLFAPTWNDDERSTTFFEWGEKLVNDLPATWNLVIKLHPNLAQHDPVLYYRLPFIEKKHPNLLIVEDFPPIYPLLEIADVYLGDYSSIGYDFLFFQKPMFFLQKPHLAKARLHTCGRVLNPSEHLFKSIESYLPKAYKFKEMQKRLYQHAFACAALDFEELYRT
jgi:CDP-glycerol glycerophosphotransferase (TagB/SpsB family)